MARESMLNNSRCQLLPSQRCGLFHRRPLSFWWAIRKLYICTYNWNIQQYILTVCQVELIFVFFKWCLTFFLVPTLCKQCDSKYRNLCSAENFSTGDIRKRGAFSISVKLLKNISQLPQNNSWVDKHMDELILMFGMKQEALVPVQAKGDKIEPSDILVFLLQCVFENPNAFGLLQKRPTAFYTGQCASLHAK